MAFVYKSQKKNEEPSILGPGAYISQPKYQYNKGFAPFSSLVERFPQKQLLKKSKILNPQNIILPGPGSYNISTDFIKEKVIVSNLQDDLKIIEVPKENSVFKSKTKKFSENIDKKLVTPGPGSYNIEKKQVEEQKIKGPSVFLSTNKEKEMIKNKSVNIIEKIISENKYKLIPSIPGKRQEFGYTETENNDLNLNPNPFLKYSGQGKDSIGPGQYNLKEQFDKNKPKGFGFYKSGSKKIINSKSQTSEKLGPGYYNPNSEFKNTMKNKPNSAFQSKIERSITEIENSGKKQKNQKINHLKSLMDKGPIDQDEEDLEIQENNKIKEKPGPATYFKKGLPSTLKIGSKPIPKQNFGSSSLRFSYEDQQLVGPGDYDPKLDINTIKTKPRIKIPFITNVERFDKNQDGDNVLSPGVYTTHQNLEDKLIRNIKKGYKGNFGSKEKRFDENKEILKNSKLPGPGSYIDPNKFINNRIRVNNENTSIFKSNSQRQVFLKGNGPSIGDYELDFYNIDRKQAVPIEFDPSLTIKKPPFNTSQPRFKHKNEKDEDTEIDPNLNTNDFNFIKNSINKGKKINKITKFQAKAERFNYKTEGLPGPGHYIQKPNNTWTKQSYNILFAEL